MTRIEIFIKTILKDILGLPLTDPSYEDFGGSQNIFYNCIVRSRKRENATIGDTCAEALRNVILHEISIDVSLKIPIVNFMKKYLTEKELENDDIEYIVTMAIAKFINVKNDQFIKKIEKNINNKNIDEYCKDKINFLYDKLNKYLYIDNELVFILSDEMVDFVCNIIGEKENIKVYINDSESNNLDYLFYRNITPKNIIVSMKNIKNLYNSFLRTDQLSLIESCITSVEIIYNWFISDYLNFETRKKYDLYKKHKSKYNYKEKYKIVDLYELLNLGWTIKSFMEDTFEMWEENLHMPKDHNGTVEQWANIANAHPENRKILLEKIDGRYEIVGYWSFIPLFDDAFKKVSSGEFHEKELTIDMIPTMITGVYNIYFVGICLKAGYRKTLAIQKLLFAVVDTFEELAQMDIFINDISAWAYSNEGESLCKSIGLIETNNHIQHGKMYRGNIKDIINKSFCQKSNIKKLYKEILI